MFIISKKNFKLRFPDAPAFMIAKDFMGDVPDYVTKHPLFQLAVDGGDILTPRTTADKDIYAEDADATVKAQKADIRPDAPKVEDSPAEDGKGRKTASGRPKRAKN